MTQRNIRNLPGASFSHNALCEAQADAAFTQASNTRVSKLEFITRFSLL